MTFRREKSKILEKGFNLKTKSGSFGALGLEMAVGTLGQEPGAGAWGRSLGQEPGAGGSHLPGQVCYLEQVG